MLCTKDGSMFSHLKRLLPKVLVTAAFLHLLLIARPFYVLNKPDHRWDFQVGLPPQSADYSVTSVAAIYLCSIVVACLFRRLGQLITVAIGVSLFCLAVVIPLSFTHRIITLYFTYGIVHGFIFNASGLTISDVVLRRTGNDKSGVICFVLFVVTLGFAVSPFFPFLKYSLYKDIMVSVVPTIFAIVGYFSTLLIVEMKNNHESPDEQVPDDDVNNANTPQPSTEEKIKLRTDMTSTGSRVDVDTVGLPNSTKEPTKSSIVMFIEMFRRRDMQMSLLNTILTATSITVIFITTGNYLWDRTMDIFSLPMIITWIGVGDIVGRTIAAVSTDRLWIWNDRVSEGRPMLFIVPYCIIAAVPYICTIFLSSPIVRKVALVGIIVPRMFLVLLLPPVAMEAIHCNEMRAERVALVYIIFGVGSFWITPISETLYDVTGSHTATWYIMVLSTMASVEALLLAAAVWARQLQSRPKSEKTYDELSEC